MMQVTLVPRQSTRAARAFRPHCRRAARPWVAPVLTVVALLASAGARGDEAPVRVSLDRPAELPFSSEQLLAAIDARVPVARAPDASAVQVRIGPGATAGRVQVVTTSAAVEVPVDGKQPPEAARLVALAVVDVTRASLNGTDSRSAETIVAAPNAPANDNGARAVPAAPGQERFSAALYPGLSTGLGGGAVAFEPSLGLSLRLGGALSPWAGALGVGFAQVSAPWSDRTFTLSTLPVRLGARWRWRRWEAGAGGALRLYDTGGLDGGRGTMQGGYASLGAWGRLTDRWQWTAVAGADAYREKTIFRAAGAPVLTTGPLVFWLGVGARWTGGAS